MESFGDIRSEISYLESLSNYLMIQLAERGEKAIVDPNHRFDIETLSRARDTISKYLESNPDPSNDENAPPKKSVDV